MVLKLYKDQKTTDISEAYQQLVDEIQKRDTVIDMLQEEIEKLGNRPTQTPETILTKLSSKLNCDIRLDYHPQHNKYCLSAYLEDSNRIMSQLCDTIKEAADNLIERYEEYNEAQYGV